MAELKPSLKPGVKPESSVENTIPENFIPSNDFPQPGVDGEELERTLTGRDLERLPTLNLEKTITDVPPDGGYGWICVMCSWFINAHTWGINAVRWQGSLGFSHY